jgi:hypothetical protein
MNDDSGVIVSIDRFDRRSSAVLLRHLLHHSSR